MALPRDDTVGISTEQVAVFYTTIAYTNCVMNTSIQIQSWGESYEALATALGHVVLKLFTTRINILLASMAMICLFCWLISGQHTAMTAMAVLAWVLHLAVTLIIDIAKGGDQL